MNDLRSCREEVVTRHIDAENRHDLDATLATFHHPCYDVVALGEIFDGDDAVRALWEGFYRGFPDLHIEAGTRHHADEAVFVEVTVTGTHEGTWAGIPPTGRRASVRVGCLFEFDADRLIAEKIYFDMATIMRQLGAI